MSRTVPYYSAKQQRLMLVLCWYNDVQHLPKSFIPVLTPAECQTESADCRSSVSTTEVICGWHRYWLLLKADDTTAGQLRVTSAAVGSCLLSSAVPVDATGFDTMAADLAGTAFFADSIFLFGANCPAVPRGGSAASGAATVAGVSLVLGVCSTPLKVVWRMPSFGVSADKKLNKN